MSGVRNEVDGIRVNGIVTPHADQELYAYLLPMPASSGERGRALKKLAFLGLQVKGQVALVGVPAVTSAAPVEPKEVQGEGAIVLVAEQPTKGGGETGGYNLAEVDLGGVDLPF